MRMVTNVSGVRRFIIILYHKLIIRYQPSGSKQLTPAKAAHLLQLREQMHSSMSVQSTPMLALTRRESNLRQPTVPSGSVSRAGGDNPFRGNGISHITYILLDVSRIYRTARDISCVSQHVDNIFDDDNDIIYHTRSSTPIEQQDEYEETSHDNDDYYNDNGDDNEEEFGEDDIRGRSQSPQVGQKRPRSPMIIPDGTTRKAIKVKEGKGKPKADDWEPAVQDVIPEAILLYENKLVSETPYPDHMQEMVWAKAAWQDGCRECEVKIHHNSKLLKIVCVRHIL